MSSVFSKLNVRLFIEFEKAFDRVQYKRGIRNAEIYRIQQGSAVIFID